MSAALLAFALALAPATPPLACPKGTERRGAAPPDGLEEWCEGKDPAGGPARREGPSRAWYDDGGLWMERGYRAGVLDGRFVERHRNGKPAREGTWERGRKTGTWRTWFETGVLEEEAEWRDGSPHGAYAAFWPSGVRRTEGRYCGGAQCGRWRSFDEAGRQIGEVEYGEQRLVP